MIILKRKIYKSAKNSKNIMQILENDDDTWKYETVQEQVEEAYLALQNAWTI